MVSRLLLKFILCLAFVTCFLLFINFELLNNLVIFNLVFVKNSSKFFSEDFINIFYNQIFKILINMYMYIILHTFLYFLFVFFICLFSTILILNKNPMYSVICLIFVYFSSSFLLVCLEVHFLAVIFILVYLGAVVVLFLFVIMMLNIKVQEKTKILTFFPFLLIFFCTLIFFYIDFNSFKEVNIKTPDLYFLSEKGFSDYYNLNLNLIDSFPKEDFYYSFLKQHLISLKKKEESFITISKFFVTENIILKNLIDVSFLTNINYFLENFKILAFILYTHFFLDLLISAFVLLVAMLGCISLTLTSDSFVLKKQDSMVQILHKNSILLKKNK